MYLYCVYCEQVVLPGSTVWMYKIKNMPFSSVVRECGIILPARREASFHRRLNP